MKTQLQKILNFALIGGAIAVMGISNAVAQRDFSKVEITSRSLGGGVHMLKGAGGNLAVLAGEDGVILIDDQFAPLSKKIQAAIAKINKKPVRFLVNTHWHFDHTGGNENFGKAGAIILAHDNVRQRMSNAQFIATFNARIPASPKVALPIITFNDTTSFHLNGETVLVRHVAPAHTDGDSIVHFKNANVIHAGDIFFNGFYPFIDVGHGGSIDGMIAGANTVLSIAKDSTKIIPGHGPLADKAALVAYRDMLVVIRDAIKSLVDAGKSKDETIAAKPSAGMDENWGKGFLKPDVFVGLVYQGMKN